LPGAWSVHDVLLPHCSVCLDAGILLALSHIDDAGHRHFHGAGHAVNAHPGTLEVLGAPLTAGVGPGVLPGVPGWAWRGLG